MTTPFGLFLKQYRYERGLTQTELAEALECRPMLISKAETGRWIPPTSFLDRLDLNPELSKVARMHLWHSRRRYTVPIKVSVHAYPLLSNLFDRLSTLHPQALIAIQNVLAAVASDQSAAKHPIRKNKLQQPAAGALEAGQYIIEDAQHLTNRGLPM